MHPRTAQNSKFALLTSGGARRYTRGNSAHYHLPSQHEPGSRRRHHQRPARLGWGPDGDRGTPPRTGASDRCRGRSNQRSRRADPSTSPDEASGRHAVVQQRNHPDLEAHRRELRVHLSDLADVIHRQRHRPALPTRHRKPRRAPPLIKRERRDSNHPGQESSRTRTPPQPPTAPPESNRATRAGATPRPALRKADYRPEPV